MTASILRRSGTATALPGESAETCPHCLQTYVYELEVRCIECDGPMCPVCVVTVHERQESYCPACGSEDAP